MAQNPEDSTNPGSVNVADEGDGPLSVDQCVTVTVTSAAGGAASTPGTGGGPGVVNSTDPNDSRAVTQAFGKGLPVNVNVA